MFRKIGIPLSLILFISFQGCAVAPKLKVTRPWFQIKNIDKPIQLGTALNIEVSGRVNPLLGEEKLLKAELYESLSSLLERRGFSIVKSQFDYRMVLIYDITKHNELKSSFSRYSYSTGNYSFSGATRTGLGVQIAQAVMAASQSSQIISKQETTTETYYTYTLALEIYDNDNMLIWKGDSTWDSYSLNVDIKIIPSLQLMLSHLPYDENIIPRIKKVKKEDFKNYFLLNCNYNWFTCPALPYKITFYLKNTSNPQLTTYLGKKVINPEAFEAYMDLIVTAEYALPIGKRNYNNPLDMSNWAKVQLGGRYYLGNDNIPVNILITLKGQSDGYYVDKCKIVSNDEYVRFEERLFEWQQAVTEMFDLYER